MDIRIVNICNNDCLYCLEQGYRSRQNFEPKEKILESLKAKQVKNNVTFYGGNPLLHPGVEYIIAESKKLGYTSVSLLTNSFNLGNNIEKLKSLGLDSIGIYFNSFNVEKHNLITNNGIPLSELLANIERAVKTFKYTKIIIHINRQNIDTLYKDIYILYKKYLVQDFEFINYFPFDRPYDKYRELLEYSINDYREEINKLFKIIKKTRIKASFFKFSKDFFGDYAEYYDYENGIIKQIGEEDKLRLCSDGIPECFKNKKCDFCFIRDNCNFL